MAGASALLQVIPMGLSGRYRDTAREIGRKYGDTPIGRLRRSYGSQFARGRDNNEKLGQVLANLDEPSLFKLVRDHKAGVLPIRLGVPWVTEATKR